MGISCTSETPVFTLASLTKGQWAAEAGKAKKTSELLVAGKRAFVPGQETYPIHAWAKAVGLDGLLGPTAWPVVLTAAFHQSMTV